MMRYSLVAVLWQLIFVGGLLGAEPKTVDTEAAARGYRWLTTKAYLTPDFDQEVFDELWKTWEEPLRSQAEQANVQERRAMAFSRYGLTQLTGAPPGTPAQYVVDQQGNWTMNCLACHQGKTAGQAIPGVPNSLYALQTLTEEVRQTKLRMKKPLARMDLGSLFIPLGTTNGTTNAVVFGAVLLHFRDADLNVDRDKPMPTMLHHDQDAPAWWLFKKKERLYCDGLAPKGHRPLMQFLLIKENGPERFREWEQDFEDIYVWLESLEAPKYPWPVDAVLAKQGESVFEANCARCHGTYGEKETYPNRIVPIEEVGTDPIRLVALTVEHRKHYGRSWFSHQDPSTVIADPGGYLAPPLDGVWASAPYFHNGSVPTLWHVLHPEERPGVWLRTENGYDRAKVGLEIAALDGLPPEALQDAKLRRKYFDTRRRGKSAQGHEFPSSLTAEERKAVLEYLKTL